MAARSEICKTPYPPERMRRLLSDLQLEAHLMVLFLKAVETLKVWEWREGQEAVREAG